MSNFTKISRLFPLTFFVASATVLATVPINTDQSSVFAQEIKPTTSSLIAQYRNDRRDRYQDNYGTRVLRAESGPDNRGRWRFYKPEDVSRDAMQAEGCIDVNAGAASWRCPRPTIRVQIDDDNWRPGPPGRDDRYGRSTRRLRAESGPDDRGRWRFYKPEDVSRDAMQAEGCVDVGAGAASWRCPRPNIRVQIDDDNWRPGPGRDDRDDRYDRSTRRLRAESGPDDRGRWRFYKPEDVSRDAMQAEGCTDVGTGGANWRCPRQTIRVEVDD